MAAQYQPLSTSSSFEPEEEIPQPGRIRRHYVDLQRRLLPTHLPIPRSRLALGLAIVAGLALTSFAIRHVFFLTGTGDGPSRTDLDAGFFKTGDVWAHNAAIAERLDRCASLGLLRNTSSQHIHTLATEHIPEQTYISAGCGLNETTLIIVSSLYFAEAYTGATFGESIWAQSIMTSLNRWGYSYMFSSLGWWNHDMAKTMEIYHKYPGQVRLVLADPEQIVVCFGEQRETCLRSHDNPDGLEEWRFIGFNFWDTNDPTYGPAYPIPDHPLGPRFTLSPAPPDLTTHFSLPYSIEPACRAQTRTRPKRAKPPRAYLMTKKTSYLSPSMPAFPWTIPALANIAKELDVQVAVGLSEDDDKATGVALRESGIADLGKLGKEEFGQKLSESFVMIGAGRPFISPSPWDSLCLGVPFINPILDWDKGDPENRAKWKMQHGHMADLHPPYVYSVHAHDYERLQQAVLGALERPIDSFIPRYMTFDAVSRRTVEMLEWDWEAEWGRVKGS